MIFWPNFVIDSSLYKHRTLRPFSSKVAILILGIRLSESYSNLKIEIVTIHLSANSFSLPSITVGMIILKSQSVGLSCTLLYLPHRQKGRARRASGIGVCKKYFLNKRAALRAARIKSRKFFSANYRFASSALFILRTASAEASNFAFSSSLKLNSTTFSQPFSPTITGTPIQISS